MVLLYRPNIRSNFEICARIIYGEDNERFLFPGTQQRSEEHSKKNILQAALDGSDGDGEAEDLLRLPIFHI